MRFVAALIAGASAAALLAGWLGALHPAGDSFAVFRREFVILLALAVLWTGWPGLLRWGVVGGAIVWLGAFVWSSRPDAQGQADLVVYQQNMLFSRDRTAAWLDAVRAADPDVLTLQEVGADNLRALAPLRGDYPYSLYCPLDPMGEMVLSRHRMIQGFCSGRDGFAAMQIDSPAGPVWVLSVHLNWPWPHRQAMQVGQIIPDMAPIEGKVVVAGDFNAVAWSHTLSRTSRRLAVQRLGPLMHTFALPGGLPLGIDHVLSNGTGWTVRQPKLGSDHHGVLAGIIFDDA